MEARLGKLVKFDQRPKTVNTEPRAPGDAQILMFTGVRYERGTPLKKPLPETQLDPTRPKRKRG